MPLLVTVVEAIVVVAVLVYLLHFQWGFILLIVVIIAGCSSLFGFVVFMCSSAFGFAGFIAVYWRCRVGGWLGARFGIGLYCFPS